MAVIRIRDFNGLVPKASARALPNDAAQVALDLVAATSEFRPVMDDDPTATSGVSNPTTLYRLARKSDGTLNTSRATGWIASASDLNFVKGQLNDDRTERTFKTFNNGSAPPRAIDATGEDRQLGVPAPESAPTAVVNEVANFTPEDRVNALVAAQQQAIDAIANNVSVVYLGADRPGTGTDGYVDRGGDIFTEEATQIMRVYRLGGDGGAVSDPYVGSGDFSWIFDPALNGFQVQSASSNPSWMAPDGTYHWAIGLPAYGITYDIDHAAAVAALEAIARPGPVDMDPAQLLTSDQCEEIVTALEDYIDPAGPLVKPAIDALRAKYEEVTSLMNGGGVASLVSTVEAFYAQASVTDEIAAAISNFANAVFDAAADAYENSGGLSPGEPP